MFGFQTLVKALGFTDAILKTVVTKQTPQSTQYGQ
jgi:hypothetical protein